MNSLKAILKKIKRERYDFVIIYTDSILLSLPVIYFCKLHKITVLQERNEFPIVLYDENFWGKLRAKIFLNIAYRRLDGMIVMTRPLMNFYARYVSRKCKMLEMPMTVDSSRFHVDKTPSPYGKHIAYCGNMDDKKDGVTNLIQAFGLFHPSHPKVKLLIIGDTTRLDGFEEIKKESDGIVFYGRANREDIPQLLMNASALALARPRNLQSLGGFPTKVGEYLCTGNPVAVTAVGDLPRFLNAENSFLVEPDCGTKRKRIDHNRLQRKCSSPEFEQLPCEFF